MDLKFKWNKSLPQLENGLGFGKELNLFAANTAAKLMIDFIPVNSMSLAISGIVTATHEQGQIYYNGPYAHFQYIGQLMVGPDGSAWAKKDEVKHYVAQDLKYSKDLHPLASSYWDRAMMNARSEQLISSVNSYRKRIAK